MDQSPATVPRGGPRALHGDDLHGNQWRGRGGDFVRKCEARAFEQCKGEVSLGFVHIGTSGLELASNVTA